VETSFFQNRGVLPIDKGAQEQPFLACPYANGYFLVNGKVVRADFAQTVKLNINASWLNNTGTNPNLPASRIFFFAATGLFASAGRTMYLSVL